MAAVSAIVSGVAAVGSAVVKGVAANKAAKRAGGRKRRAEQAIENIQATRQNVINPYAGVTSAADMAKNLSGGLSNPYANLGVATQAAEMQAEEADIALANTLDTLRATGAGAGGATALAQAALRSKKGISASIESQEANNDRLRAQGETIQDGVTKNAVEIDEFKFDLADAGYTEVVREVSTDSDGMQRFVAGEMDYDDESFDNESGDGRKQEEGGGD